MPTHRPAAAVVAAVIAAAEPLEPRRLAAAHRPVRVGVLGDSYSDEYRFYPPARSHAANWVEQLARHHRANFGQYAARARPASRNQGYADDWAESGATSADLPAQAAGVAAQAAAGKVDVITILIGGNDFLNPLESAAVNPFADTTAIADAMPAVAADVVAHLRSALTTIRAAAPAARVVLVTLPPVSALPLVAAGVAAEPSLAPVVAAADSAEALVNAGLSALATADPAHVAVADFAAAVATAFAAPYPLGRATLDPAAAGNSPLDGFTADGVHPGTAVQALLANTIAATTAAAFALNVKPLTPRQILADAHLPR